MKKHRHRWGPLQADKYDPQQRMIWRPCACGAWKCTSKDFLRQYPVFKRVQTPSSPTVADLTDLLRHQWTLDARIYDLELRAGRMLQAVEETQRRQDGLVKTMQERLATAGRAMGLALQRTKAPR